MVSACFWWLSNPWQPVAQVYACVKISIRGTSAANSSGDGNKQPVNLLYRRSLSFGPLSHGEGIFDLWDLLIEANSVRSVLFDNAG